VRFRVEAFRITNRAALSCLLSFLAVFAACVYHHDHVCSPVEVQYPDTDACVCAANSIPVKRPINVLVPQATDQPLIAMCTACGEHSTATNGSCVCDAGYVKGTSGCVVSNLGAACASDGECLDGDAHRCQLATDATSGYCTTMGCAANADCNTSADYACAVNASPTFCRRPPSNQGKACATQGLDPTCGAEAPICALGQCITIVCTLDSDCSPSRKCCDLSAVMKDLHACLETCP
jgi:hypothetical protein